MKKSKKRFDYSSKHRALGLTITSLVYQAVKRCGSPKGLTVDDIKKTVWKAHRISLKHTQIYAAVQNLSLQGIFEAFDPHKRHAPKNQQKVRRPVGRPRGSSSNVVPFFKRKAA